MQFASAPIAVERNTNSTFGNDSASFDAYFTGSPLSLKTGSFQNRFYPGGSPGYTLGPIAMPDIKRGLASSWESDAGAWLKAVKASDSSMHDDELCRNYTCCGIALPDLHALLDHFESLHVEVLDHPYSNTSQMSTPDSTPAFDADDMEISEPSPSPPSTPSPTLHFDPPAAFFRTPAYHSSYSSLAGANGAHMHLQTHAPTPPASAFNRYAGYSDYSSALPGTDPSPTYTDIGLSPGSTPENAARCVPPALLCSNSNEPSPLNTPVSSRTNSPVYLPLHPQGTSASSQNATQNPIQSETQPAISQPSTSPSAASSGAQAAFRGSASASSITPTKPFHCPKVGCNKSYKQQNGLKYHLSHGQCNFAPRDPDIEHLSESERDRRLRPFVCGVTDCGRRYKNMNGLRYHYTHTGDHGRLGLDMLARGIHPLPEGGKTSLGAGKGKSSGSAFGMTGSGYSTPTGSGFNTPATSAFNTPAGSSLNTPATSTANSPSHTPAPKAYYPSQAASQLQSKPTSPLCAPSRPPSQPQTQSQPQSQGQGQSQRQQVSTVPIAVTPLQLHPQTQTQNTQAGFSGGFATPQNAFMSAAQNDFVSQLFAQTPSPQGQMFSQTTFAQPASWFPVSAVAGEGC